MTLKDSWDFDWKYGGGYSRWRGQQENSNRKAEVVSYVCSVGGEAITLVCSVCLPMTATPMLEPHIQGAERSCEKDGLDLKGLETSLSREPKFLQNHTALTEERKTNASTQFVSDVWWLFFLFCFFNNSTITLLFFILGSFFYA